MTVEFYYNCLGKSTESILCNREYQFGSDPSWIKGDDPYSLRILQWHARDGILMLEDIRVDPNNKTVRAGGVIIKTAEEQTFDQQDDTHDALIDNVSTEISAEVSTAPLESGQQENKEQCSAGSEEKEEMVDENKHEMEVMDCSHVDQKNPVHVETCDKVEQRDTGTDDEQVDEPKNQAVKNTWPVEDDGDKNKENEMLLEKCPDAVNGSQSVLPQSSICEKVIRKKTKRNKKPSLLKSEKSSSSAILVETKSDEKLEETRTSEPIGTCTNEPLETCLGDLPIEVAPPVELETLKPENCSTDDNGNDSTENLTVPMSNRQRKKEEKMNARLAKKSQKIAAALERSKKAADAKSKLPQKRDAPVVYKKINPEPEVARENGIRKLKSQKEHHQESVPHREPADEFEEFLDLFATFDFDGDMFIYNPISKKERNAEERKLCRELLKLCEDRFSDFLPETAILVNPKINKYVGKMVFYQQAVAFMRTCQLSYHIANTPLLHYSSDPTGLGMKIFNAMKNQPYRDFYTNDRVTRAVAYLQVRMQVYKGSMNSLCKKIYEFYETMEHCSYKYICGDLCLLLDDCPVSKYRELDEKFYRFAEFFVMIHARSDICIAFPPAEHIQSQADTLLSLTCVDHFGNYLASEFDHRYFDGSLELSIDEQQTLEWFETDLGNHDNCTLRLIETTFRTIIASLDQLEAPPPYAQFFKFLLEMPSCIIHVDAYNLMIRRRLNVKNHDHLRYALKLWFGYEE